MPDGPASPPRVVLRNERKRNPWALMTNSTFKGDLRHGLPRPQVSPPGSAIGRYLTSPPPRPPRPARATKSPRARPTATNAGELPSECLVDLISTRQTLTAVAPSHRGPQRWGRPWRCAGRSICRYGRVVTPYAERQLAVISRSATSASAGLHADATEDP